MDTAEEVIKHGRKAEGINPDRNSGFFKIDGVEIHFRNLPDFTKHEAREYIKLCKTQTSNKIVSIECIGGEDGGVTLLYESRGVPFERIRRITGYLTGDLNSWNNAKREEEHERVKHG